MSEKVKSQENDRDSDSYGINKNIGDRNRITIETYLHKVADQINKNWNYSTHLSGSRRNLMAAIVFHIYPSGEIKDYFFTKRSGDSYLDDTVEKTIKKSSPVLAHPKGIKRQYIVGALTFTPSGVD